MVTPISLTLTDLGEFDLFDLFVANSAVVQKEEATLAGQCSTTPAAPLPARASNQQHSAAHFSNTPYYHHRNSTSTPQNDYGLKWIADPTTWFSGYYRSPGHVDLPALPAGRHVVSYLNMANLHLTFDFLSSFQHLDSAI